MPTWPIWLRDIAVAVNELLQAGAWVRQRFRKMVKQADKAPTGDLPQTRGVVLAPQHLVRALRLEEKYVRLAAIHDVICKDVKPINPYVKDEPAVRRKRAQPCLLYAIRMSNVRCLNDADRPRLEQALEDVAHDLDLPNPISNAEPIHYVTLSQVAALVSRSKRTFEKYSDLPEPDVRGQRGKPSEWAWARIRPWLEQHFDRQLPERFPASRVR